MALDFPASPTVGATYTVGGTSWGWDGVKWAPSSPAYHVSMNINGRLTLTSGAPVMTADVSAGTTIYFTPYQGNRIWLYDGTLWQSCTFSELSLALTGVAHVANTSYDLFIVNNAGTLQLASGPAWSSNTARSAALALLNGIYVNAAAITVQVPGGSYALPAQQGLYVGTFRTTATAGQTAMIMNPAGVSGGAAPYLLLWNMYNRKQMRASSVDNGSPYTGIPSSWRSARGSSGNAINFIIGLIEDAILASIAVAMISPATAGAYANIGIGFDSTTPFVSVVMQPSAAYATNYSPFVAGIIAPNSTLISIGAHYFSRVEMANVTTWGGDQSSSDRLDMLFWC